MSRLYGQFPGDVGCFSPYLLNILHLSPGESLYLAPNEPHAYLYGGMTCAVFTGGFMQFMGLIGEYNIDAVFMT